MSLISVVVNCDNRSENNNEKGLGNGVVSPDFLDEGIFNKIQFFKGFDIELIVYLDQHSPISDAAYKYLMTLTDKLVLSKHQDIPNQNDFNYQNALFLARGEYIVHFDQDTSAFTSGKEAVQEYLDLLETHKYISYPSHWTPNAVHDDSFNYKWCSTRFFMCKRETIDFTELRKCQENYQYYIEKYKPSRVCHWTEHLIGITAASSVFYPPINHEKLSIFSWGSYDRWLLKRLNNFTYDEVKGWLNDHPIQYPNDILI